jgi:hypothetical protein
MNTRTEAINAAYMASVEYGGAYHAYEVPATPGRPCIGYGIACGKIDPRCVRAGGVIIATYVCGKRIK